MPTGDQAKAAAGPASFEAFFEANREALFSALWLVTRNRHEAEDLMQEAFTRLWDRWEKVGSLSDPVGYLYRTAMNAFRSSRRRATLAAKRAVRLIPADDEMARVEAMDWTIRALAPLSRRQRAAVVLTDLLGYTSEEAARMLGIRASTLRVHATRARTALKRTLGGNE